MEGPVLKRKPPDQAGRYVVTCHVYLTPWCGAMMSALWLQPILSRSFSGWTRLTILGIICGHARWKTCPNQSSSALQSRQDLDEPTVELCLNLATTTWVHNYARLHRNPGRDRVWKPCRFIRYVGRHSHSMGASYGLRNGLLPKLVNLLVG